jgi:hypothetical protein
VIYPDSILNTYIYIYIFTDSKASSNSFSIWRTWDCFSHVETHNTSMVIRMTIYKVHSDSVQKLTNYLSRHLLNTTALCIQVVTQIHQPSSLWLRGVYIYSSPFTGFGCGWLPPPPPILVRCTVGARDMIDHDTAHTHCNHSNKWPLSPMVPGTGYKVTTDDTIFGIIWFVRQDRNSHEKYCHP